MGKLGRILSLVFRRSSISADELAAIEEQAKQHEREEGSDPPD